MQSVHKKWRKVEKHNITNCDRYEVTIYGICYIAIVPHNKEWGTTLHRDISSPMWESRKKDFWFNEMDYIIDPCAETSIVLAEVKKAIAKDFREVITKKFGENYKYEKYLNRSCNKYEV